LQSLRQPGIDAFRFLSHQVIVIANRELAALELFVLSKSNGHTGTIPVSKVAELALPPIDDGCTLRRLTFSNLPVKDPATRRRRQTHDSSIFTKPFTSALPDIIFVFASLMGGDSNDFVSFVSFVVHSSALLSHVPPSSHENLQNTIPWHMWGPASTRWFLGPRYSAIEICSQRCLVRGLSFGSREIWDFNPYRIGVLGKDFAMESDTARISVESDPSYINVRGLKEAVCSSLPFVKFVPKKWHRYKYVCLDDDRIIGMHSTVSTCSH
jgi:hypothetical protein